MIPIKVTKLKIEPQSHVRSTKGDAWLFAVSDEYLQEYDKKRALISPDSKVGRNLNRKRQLEKYNAYKEELRWIAKKQGFELPNGCFSIHFYIPMPKSWRRKKRLERVNMKHTSKPDCDNMIKSLIDGLIHRKNKSKGETGRDDKEIWSYAAFKYWVEPDDACIVIKEYIEDEFILAFKNDILIKPKSVLQ
jgi:Holliday junction resolvase RusA-like endonuclease